MRGELTRNSEVLGKFWKDRSLAQGNFYLGRGRDDLPQNGGSRQLFWEPI